MSETKIGRFSQPVGVIEKITNSDQKRMLMQLYREYRRLCAFAHGSAQSSFLKTSFWERSPLRPLTSESERQAVFEKEVADTALLHSVLSVVQAACEVATLYPANIELERVVTEAWIVLSEMNLLGRIIWEIRARSALRIVLP